MTEPFIGEIQLMAGNQVPSQWVLCDGTELEIQFNTVMYSLIGNTYGGNGTTTFRLPNLMGCIVCGAGDGPGLSPRKMGDQFGTYTAQLDPSSVPPHSHPMNLFFDRTSSDRGTDAIPGGHVTSPGEAYALVVNPSTTVTASNSPMIAQASGGGAHENRQPVVGLNYMIAMTGIMPA
jgi:microcystin-dependent protein